MSGGSFNYLYCQEPYKESELRAMADWLRERGMARAADETLTFIQSRADEALTRLWISVEWCASADWTMKDVIEAHQEYTEIRDAPH